MISESTKATKDLGRRVATVLEGGENLLLMGDLGSGKTIFTQGLAEGLGVTDSVKSPTYTYLREYELPKRLARLAHFDLYRLPEQPTKQDLDSIELLAYLDDPDVITVVEWAEKLSGLRPPEALPVIFENVGASRRNIKLPPLLKPAEPA